MENLPAIEVPSKMFPPQKAIAKSVWKVEHWRGKEFLGKTVDENVVTDEGLNQLLRIMFTGGSQIPLANWYILIFNTNTTPAAGTTYAVPVFTEEEGYDSATRPLCELGTVASESVDNSLNVASFVINGTGDGNTIYGGALVGGDGAAVKGDVADADGRMYAAAKFGTAKPVLDTDILKITVTLTAADA